MVCSTENLSFSKHSYRIILYLVLAAMAIANIVRTSLGPLGLDKMLVDDIGVSLGYEWMFSFKINVFFSITKGCYNYK